MKNDKCKGCRYKKISLEKAPCSFCNDNHCWQEVIKPMQRLEEENIMMYKELQRLKNKLKKDCSLNKVLEYIDDYNYDEYMKNY